MHKLEHCWKSESHISYYHTKTIELAGRQGQILRNNSTHIAMGLQVANCSINNKPALLWFTWFGPFESPYTSLRQVESRGQMLSMQVPSKSDLQWRNLVCYNPGNNNNCRTLWNGHTDYHQLNLPIHKYTIHVMLCGQIQNVIMVNFMILYSSLS